MAPKKKFNRFPKKRKPGFSLDEEISFLNESCKSFDSSRWETFEAFPISRKTKQGLQKAGFERPTAIQRDGIAHALRGDNVLGAAKTGSGKTLAFVVPVLERLYKSKWSKHDGLGALIITPTRELALQIFNVFRLAGGDHDFSIGAVIGGKDLNLERKVIDQCNIIVGTPGRILHHLEKTSTFDCGKLQMLILDEADQTLDLGFADEINKIVSYLPLERQTLLFSATLTNSVRDLARLQLKKYAYVSAHEHAEHSTPANLHQSYAVCNLEDKTNTLWAFIGDHPGKKILVFMSTCKQVKYLHAAFCRLRPQTTIFELTSKMHQEKRTATYDSFHRKQNAVLFATDVAARGLDFPGIDWVVQLDCPQDSKTYIHRVGRTARHEDGGQSVLLLLPSEEEEMMKELAAKKIPISKKTLRKANVVETKLQVLLSRDVTLKECAQRAFVTYFKSVFLMKNKKIFDVRKLNKDEYAKSLGLFQAPRIRFLQAAEKRSKLKNETRAKVERTNDAKSVDEEDALCPDESDEELLVVKHGPTNVPDDFSGVGDVPERSAKNKKQTKAALAKRMLKQKVKPNTRIVFDDEGEVAATFPAVQAQLQTSSIANIDSDDAIDVEKQKEMMKAEDRIDKEVYRQKIKEDHKQKRLKEKEARRKREKGEDEEEEEEDDDEDEDEDEDDENDAKRMRRNDSSAWPTREESRSERRKEMKMPLAQQEELALRLLTSKR